MLRKHQHKIPYQTSTTEIGKKSQNQNAKEKTKTLYFKSTNIFTYQKFQHFPAEYVCIQFWHELLSCFSTTLIKLGLFNWNCCFNNTFKAMLVVLVMVLVNCHRNRNADLSICQKIAASHFLCSTFIRKNIKIL